MLLLSHTNKHTYMASEVISRALWFYTQIYMNNKAKLLKVRMQKNLVHYAVRNIATVQVLSGTADAEVE